MRAYFVLVSIVVFAVFCSSVPHKRKRQINPDDETDLSGDVEDRWWWNRPTRPTRPTQPTRPNTLAPISSTPPRPTVGPVVTPVEPSPAAFDRCMRNCLRTQQYDPLCVVLNSGMRKTYNNGGEMACAEACGEVATLLFRGSCSAIS